MIRFVRLQVWLLLALASQAHALSAPGSTLTLSVDAARVHGEWQIALAALDTSLALDANGDGEIAWAEIESRRAEIEEHLASHVAVLANGERQLVRFNELIYGARAGVPSLLSRFSLTAPAEIESLTLDYTLLLAQDLAHRGSVEIIWPDRGTHLATLTASSPTIVSTRDSATSKGFFELLKSGIWHIWIGYDHVLFLIVLLIPAVFRRTPQGREAVPDFGAAFARVLVIVSSFTVAHSITLACAALQWIVLPSRLVESAIAISVGVAAVINLLPRTAGVTGAWVAFAFGLLHGFGFANVLSELGAEGTPLWRTLVGFNLGVEIGQLAIVAAFLPVAYLIRHTTFYRTGVLYGGSSAAAVCALVWFWQRAL